MNYILLLIFSLMYFVVRVATKKGVGRWWMCTIILWWGLLIFVSSLNPWGLYEVSLSSYIIFTVFVAFYIAGFGSGLSRNSVKPETLIEINIQYDKILINKFFILLLLCVILILARYLYKYALHIAIAGAMDSRVARFETGIIFESSFEIILFEYVVAGFVWFLKFIVAYGVVFSSIKNKTWILSLIACGMYMGFGGGRNIALEVGIMVVFLLAFSQGGRALNILSKNIKIILFAGLLYFGSVVATLVRVVAGDVSFDAMVEANSILLEHGLIYFIGSFRAFDYAYQNLQNLFLYSFGLMTGSGLDEIFSLGMRLIGFNILPYSGEWGGILSMPISIGDNQEFNALYTAIFNFYFDFGFMGVSAGAFVFGYVCSIILSMLISRGSISLLFCVNLLFVSSILSVLTWKFSTGSVVMLLVLSLLIGLLNRKSFHFFRVGR